MPGRQGHLELFEGVGIDLTEEGRRLSITAPEGTCAASDVPVDGITVADVEVRLVQPGSAYGVTDRHAAQIERQEPAQRRPHGGLVARGLALRAHGQSLIDEELGVVGLQRVEGPVGHGLLDAPLGDLP
ncbi:MAG: hypothetical protein GVY32_01745 [Gammaproteobacteria bacterium]|nr:hypothetical protein [Gammaproteobacteria bacterium]